MKSLNSANARGYYKESLQLITDFTRIQSLFQRKWRKELPSDNPLLLSVDNPTILKRQIQLEEQKNNEKLQLLREQLNKNKIISQKLNNSLNPLFYSFVVSVSVSSAPLWLPFVLPGIFVVPQVILFSAITPVVICLAAIGYCMTSEFYNYKVRSIRKELQGYKEYQKKLATYKDMLAIYKDKSIIIIDNGTLECLKIDDITIVSQNLKLELELDNKTICALSEYIFSPESSTNENKNIVNAFTNQLRERCELAKTIVKLLKDTCELQTPIEVHCIGCILKNISVDYLLKAVQDESLVYDIIMSILYSRDFNAPEGTDLLYKKSIESLKSIEASRDTLDYLNDLSWILIPKGATATQWLEILILTIDNKFKSEAKKAFFTLELLNQKQAPEEIKKLIQDRFFDGNPSQQASLINTLISSSPEEEEVKKLSDLIEQVYQKLPQDQSHQIDKISCQSSIKEDFQDPDNEIVESKDSQKVVDYRNKNQSKISSYTFKVKDNYTGSISQDPDARLKKALKHAGDVTNELVYKYGTATNQVENYKIIEKKDEFKNLQTPDKCAIMLNFILNVNQDFRLSNLDFKIVCNQYKNRTFNDAIHENWQKQNLPWLNMEKIYNDFIHGDTQQQIEYHATHLVYEILHHAFSDKALYPVIG